MPNSEQKKQEEEKAVLRVELTEEQKEDIQKKVSELLASFDT